MTQDISSLYIKYGNRIASGVAICLYDRIQNDDSLTPYFKGIDMDSLTEHMGDMLCMITGGPDLYKGQDIKTAHAPFKIDDRAFMAVVQHLILAFEDAGIEKEDGQMIIDHLAMQKDDIVTA